MKKIYVETPQDAGNKRYTYNENTGTVSRAPVELIDPIPTKIGSADNLSDALSIIKSNHGGSSHKVTIKDKK